MQIIFEPEESGICKRSGCKKSDGCAGASSHVRSWLSGDERRGYIRVWVPILLGSIWPSDQLWILFELVKS